MHLGAVSVAFIGDPLAAALSKMAELGLEAVEIVCGGVFPKDHCHPAELLANLRQLDKFKETIAGSGIKISALAMHGEPLDPNPKRARVYERDFLAACRLSEKLGIRRMTLIAGLPEGAPGDKSPNWILFPFPPGSIERLHWQWDKRVIPFWTKQGKIARDHGVDLCFEMVPGDVVYNPETLLRLREAVGRGVCCNFDPSHLFFLGIDPIEAIKALGPVIRHVHAKDAAISAEVVRVNGGCDPKSFNRLRERSWLYRTVGYGHGEHFWREFVSALRLIGYDDVLSIEHEDLLIDADEGFELAVGVLKGVLLRRPVRKQWFGSEE